MNTQEVLENSREDEDKIRMRNSFLIASVFLFLLWAVKLFETVSGIDLTEFGVYPQKAKGLIGIITSPFIHANYSHLISNSASLFFLTFGLFYFYRKSAIEVFVIIYILSGIIVWITARPAYHIGASGLIYGFASFLFFAGVFRKDTSSIALSLLVTFLYGGLVWGILPTDAEVSFESHFAGAMLGLICAVAYRKQDPLKKYDWEDEEESPDEPGEEEEVPIDEDADEVHFKEDELYDEELEEIKRKYYKKDEF